MAKANRLDALQAIGRRYWPDGNDIQPCKEVVQEVLAKGFGDKVGGGKLGQWR